MKQLALILITLCAFPVLGQQTISLEECYNLVAKNYPLVKQMQLLKTQHELDNAVISNSRLPQLNLNAQVTYQSDVTEVPIANSNIEPLNNDQYRATLSVNQLIYNGGTTNAFLKQQSARLKTKQKQIEVSLYQLKQQINQLYFSILLSQETTLLLNAKETQLKATLTEVKAGVKYGVLLPASDKILEAELIKIKQQFIEIKNTKATLIETLSGLIGQNLNTSTKLKQPLIKASLTTKIKRPELDLFQYKKEEIGSSETLLAKQIAPKILGFATGGYGNPGLNMLDNSFQPFYTVGVKLNWNVFDWNTNKKQRKSLVINKEIIDNEVEIFKLNTNIELHKQQQEINKITLIINTDLEIIKLRKEVLETAASQLKNGVITSSAYSTELTNLYEAENTLIKHKIQLQLAKANYRVIKGS